MSDQSTYSIRYVINNKTKSRYFPVSVSQAIFHTPNNDYEDVAQTSVHDELDKLASSVYSGKLESKLESLESTHNTDITSVNERIDTVNSNVSNNSLEITKALQRVTTLEGLSETSLFHGSTNGNVVFTQTVDPTVFPKLRITFVTQSGINCLGNMTIPTTDTITNGNHIALVGGAVGTNENDDHYICIARYSVTSTGMTLQSFARQPGNYQDSNQLWVTDVFGLRA